MLWQFKPSLQGEGKFWITRISRRGGCDTKSHQFMQLKDTEIASSRYMLLNLALASQVQISFRIYS